MRVSVLAAFAERTRNKQTNEELTKKKSVLWFLSDTSGLHSLSDQADLEHGAVMKVVHKDGETGGKKPEEGDLVKFHYTVRKGGEETVVETSRGGDPAVFVLGKACRMPRGLELAIHSMTKGESSSFTIKPSYGFKHPDCSWRLEDPQLEEDALDFDIELVDYTNGVSVQVVNDTKLDEMVLKETVKDGTGWENPRPPYKAVVHVRAQESESGATFFQTKEEEPLTFQFGENAVPEMLEEAIGLMFKGEVAKIYSRKPLESSRLIGAAAGQSGGTQIQLYEVSLLDVIQVRDVIGTKEIMKMRVKDGKGEFPIDCPIMDCHVKIHCIGRLKESGEVFWDTRKDDKGNKGPFCFETGLNVVPEGLEMCIKLMVPEETSIIQCASKYAYDGFKDDGDPIGKEVPPNCDVEWEVTLLEFEKPKNMANLTTSEVVAEGESRKGKANALFKAAKYKMARTKYEQLVKELKSVIETEVTEEEAAEGDAVVRLVVSCTLNLAACAQKLGEHTVALKHCDEVLQLNPDNAKALYRRGQTYIHLSEWDLARKDYQKMGNVNGEMKLEAETNLTRIDRLEKEALKQQKMQFQGFFNR